MHALPLLASVQVLPKLPECVSCAVKLIEAIREFNRAVPFMPYEIRTNGGERLRVPHPDFILVSPKGAWVIVTDEKEHPRHISSILIKEVEPIRKRSARRRTTKAR